MRLWSLHPKYLDAKGLVALWRETLLARAVLHEQTKGYRNHPQLDRFKAVRDPKKTMDFYLMHIHAEAVRRGYNFDASKFEKVRKPKVMPVTDGQVAYEWQHLDAKRLKRDPAKHAEIQGVFDVEVHPLFVVEPGGIADWERT